MRKSVKKRIRVTKTGKLIRRHMGVDHFRARKTSKNIQQVKKNGVVHRVDVLSISRYSNN